MSSNINYIRRSEASLRVAAAVGNISAACQILQHICMLHACPDKAGSESVYAAKDRSVIETYAVHKLNKKPEGREGFFLMQNRLLGGTV